MNDALRRARAAVSRVPAALFIAAALTACGAGGAGTASVPRAPLAEDRSRHVLVESVGTITEYPLPRAFRGEFIPRITNGTDGRLWFTNDDGPIGAITTTGVVSSYAAGSGALDIRTANDGTLWFAEYGANKIGAMTETGVVTEYEIPTANSVPEALAPGLYANWWFTEFQANKIGYLTPAGTFAEFDVPTAASEPKDIAGGIDTDLYFTEFAGNKIGRITPYGAITEYAIPTKNSGPAGISVGPDGNMWFLESNANKIASLSNGTITEYPIPNGRTPWEITSGPNGTVWFTLLGSNQIGSFSTTAHTFNDFTIPSPNSYPEGIVWGDDSNMWFTEGNTHKIASIWPG